MTNTIQLNIKSSSEAGKATVEIDLDSTVLQLKEKIKEIMDIPVDQQRLIYSGRILKDADVLGSYKMETGHTVHLVKGKSASTAASSTSSNAASAASTNAQTTSQASPTANPFAQQPGLGANPFMNPFAAMGGQVRPPFGAGAGAQDPFAQMMQTMLSNPQLMESMLANNPMASQMGVSPEQYRQMLQDPMFQAMISNPQFLQSVMSVAGGLQQASPGANPLGNFTGSDPNTASGLPPLPNPMLNNPLLAQMMAGGLANPAATPANQEPPEIRFASQLQQLQDMGFYDATMNVRALSATGGNVNAAVEYLLRQI